MAGGLSDLTRGPRSDPRADEDFMVLGLFDLFNHRCVDLGHMGCILSTVERSAHFTEAAMATPPLAADTKASAAEDDDVDLFGEETEEEKKAAEEHAAAVKTSGKKKESGKSSVLLDVKPWDDETDMKKLEEAVRSIKMEGLFWGASKLVPVGYGIKKLQIMMTIVDYLGHACRGLSCCRASK